jgi:hypothetical protein
VAGAYAHTVERPESLDSVPSRNRVWIRWSKWLVILFAFLWLASIGLSFVIRHSPLQRKLTAHLEAAFGRPVEVGSYQFTLWNGPSLEAQSVTVAEDSRFGHEYFLRADSISVRLRWQSLLRGHLELGTLSLSHPSLNLVRDSTGEWNLTEWLPHPGENISARVPVGPSLLSSSLRFRRIEIDGGRINFKRRDEKLPLAFVGVSGAVETDSPGLWHMDLEATPWRAAVLLQQVGTIHVSGHVGGTSSRLRPAALDLSWTDASISDVLRLARGDDYGVRGTLALALNASTLEPGDTWALQARAQLGGLHRWDLASRADNPSVNLIGQARWHEPASLLELMETTLETPNSNVHAVGRISLYAPHTPPKEASPAVQISVTSSQIDVADLLDWLRAFHSNVADGVSGQGLVAVRGDVSGWPLRVVNAIAVSDGVDLTGTSLQAPAHLGSVQFRYDGGAVSFLPVVLSFATPNRPVSTRSGNAAAPQSDGSFQMSVSTKPARGAVPAWHIAGNSREMRDLVSAAGALGWNISRGWDLAGPFACDLLWHGTHSPWREPPTGWIDFGELSGSADASAVGAALHAPFLNQPVDQIRARADLRPDKQHIALISAHALGAQWSGTFDRTDARPEWQFDLSADRLAAADLDRWLNPLWRASFLDRMLPFLNSSLPAVAVPDNLRAGGRLNLDQFILPPLAVHHLQADLKIGGRHIELADATGQFYGGTLAGSLDADLQVQPVYNADIAVSRVDLSELSAASLELANLFDGSASGDMSFSARGATRADLLASLECQGQLDVDSPELHGIDLVASLRASTITPGASHFSDASASFACSAKTIHVRDLSLTAPGPDVAGSGTVDFSRNLDFRLALVSSSSKSDEPTHRLTGSLASPKIARIAPLSRRSR